MHRTAQRACWLLSCVLACAGCATEALLPRDSVKSAASANIGEGLPTSDRLLEAALGAGIEPSKAIALARTVEQLPPDHRALMTNMLLSRDGRRSGELDDRSPEKRPEGGPETDPKAVESSAHDRATPTQPSAGRLSSALPPSSMPNVSPKLTLDEHEPPARSAEYTDARNPTTPIATPIASHVASREGERHDLPISATERPVANPPKPLVSTSPSNDLAAARTAGFNRPPSPYPREANARAAANPAVAPSLAGQALAGQALPNGVPLTQPKIPLDWRKQLRSALVALQQQSATQEFSGPDEQTRRQVQVALLQLVLDNREQALAALHDLNEDELEFWRQTLLGMGILLDADGLPRIAHRVDSATQHFRSGIDALSNLGPLQLHHAALCRVVQKFGDYEEFAAYTFKPNEQVVLYVEIANATLAQKVPDSAKTSSRRNNWRGSLGTAEVPLYEMRLGGRYDLLDQNRRPAESHTLSIKPSYSRSYLRDNYIAYPVTLPSRLSPGSYTLDVTIEDINGSKYGNAVIDFRIR